MNHLQSKYSLNHTNLTWLCVLATDHEHRLLFGYKSTKVLASQGLSASLIVQYFSSRSIIALTHYSIVTVEVTRPASHLKT